MKLPIRSTIATFAIAVTLATPAFAYVAAQSFERVTQSNSATEIQGIKAQVRVTKLTGMEV